MIGWIKTALAVVIAIIIGRRLRDDEDAGGEE